jgi:hypothetical protein
MLAIIVEEADAGNAYETPLVGNMTAEIRRG